MARVDRTVKLAALVVSAVVVLGLAGCTASASPSPPAGVSSAPPAITTLTVSPGGIGDLAVGRPVTSFALVTYGAHACPATGGWLPRYPRGADTSSGQLLDPFDIVTQGGHKSTSITKEFVWSRQIATAKGIRVGSPLAAVESAYPTATRSSSYSTAVFVVNGSRGRLVIEVAGDNAFAKGEWPTAVLGTVVWMQVVPLASKASSIANNDDAGPCPIKGHVPDLDDD